MESQALRSAVRRLRHAVLSPPAGPDAELLRAFAGRRDGRAFETLVRRHGPMVLGVCRRVLRDPADADDAFQAVFLVLVRKAGSLRQPDRLAGWLHQVAHRTAKKLRAVAEVAGQFSEEESAPLTTGMDDSGGKAKVALKPNAPVTIYKSTNRSLPSRSSNKGPMKINA